MYIGVLYSFGKKFFVEVFLVVEFYYVGECYSWMLYFIVNIIYILVDGYIL